MNFEEKKISNIAETNSVNATEVKVGVQGLHDFNAESDMDYFKSLEGDDGWIAIGMDNCLNQKYFIVMGDNGEKLGIVGVYDTEDEKNITHIVVDPKYRRQGLVSKFYNSLLSRVDLQFLTATISRDNIVSYKAHEKAGFKKVSSDRYEDKYDKFKYQYWKDENKI